MSMECVYSKIQFAQSQQLRNFVANAITAFAILLLSLSPVVVGNLEVSMSMI